MAMRNPAIGSCDRTRNASPTSPKNAPPWLVLRPGCAECRPDPLLREQPRVGDDVSAPGRCPSLTVGSAYSEDTERRRTSGGRRRPH